MIESLQTQLPLRTASPLAVSYSDLADSNVQSNTMSVGPAMKTPTKRSNDMSQKQRSGTPEPVTVQPRLKKKPRRIALIVESALAPRRRMLLGIARYMQEHEPLAIYIKPGMVEKSFHNWLQDWRGDGIIAAVNEADTDFVMQQDVPVVDMVGVFQFAGVPVVRANDFAIGKLGAEHLIERGFRNIGFSEYTDWRFSVRRREGFAHVGEQHDIPCSVHGMPVPIAGRGGPQKWEQQQRELMEWLVQLPKPVGIMASTDTMGQQILEACQRLDIRVPEEVAVVGADNDEPICAVSWPPLSSVILDDPGRGYAAMELLHRMMDGKPVDTDMVLIEPLGVAARASTDIMATDDQVVTAAVRFIRDNACEGINVEDVLKVVPICRSSLERRFKHVVGRSLNDEIVRLRINRAIELLTDTDMELKVIAHRAGFSSQSYMTIVFNSKLGRTPGSYRTGK